jgi:hypothetical protein
MRGAKHVASMDNRRNGYKIAVDKFISIDQEIDV